MAKGQSKKIKEWTKKDVALNVFVYVINTLIIMGLFIAAAAINSVHTGEDFIAYLIDFKSPMHLILMLTCVIVSMFIYFLFEDKNFLKSASNSQMLFLVMEVSLILVFSAGRFINVYLRPLALAGLLVLFLTKDKKNAIFINILFCILVFLMDNFTNSALPITYSALLVGFLAGIIGIFLESKVFSRLYLLIYSLVMSVPTTIFYISTFIENGDANFVASLVSAVSSGLVTGVLVLFLLPIFEVMFKRVTCFKLAELTDHKSRLIRKIITEAPGTFNHSIIVSNIAEACAIAIGEDSLLARTCAYYHDAGKLRRPEYFTENQITGINPHDELTPELSTNIIRSHAQDGYQLAIKSGLPKEIADVCLQHHGTLPIFFFYDKAKKFTDGEVDIARYSYVGPVPQTKIAAIIMIADGCEAATRTLVDRSRENVTKLVRKIVSDRMAMGQFDQCDITLEELNIIINTVINSLSGVYHSRVQYPTVSLDGIKDEVVKKEEGLAVPQSILPTEKEEEPKKRGRKKSNQ